MADLVSNNDVWLDNNSIYFRKRNGDVKSQPLEWFPRLLNASEAERKNFEISPFGIHWPKLDEDISFDGFDNFSKN